MTLLLHPAFRAAALALSLSAASTTSLVSPVTSVAPTAVLTPESVAGWHAYVAAVEARHRQEARDPSRFLGLDFTDDREVARAELRAGRIWLESLTARDTRGGEVDVPKASVHHWRGAVFIPGIGADAMLSRLESEAPGLGQEDVVSARVAHRAPGFQRVSLRLRQSRILTVVLDTDHDVMFERLASGYGRSTSIATRIVEVEHAGQPDERQLEPGRDRGFLWRWRAYWRFRDVPGGVVAECESVSLSRDVPLLLRPVAGPLIRGTARESMSRTLETLRRRFAVTGSVR